MARVPEHLKSILDQRPEYEKWMGPDRVSACTWTKGASTHDSPHNHQSFKWEEPKIHDSALGKIGKTPLIRLHHIPKSEGIKCEMLVKCEFYNTAGSVKDRIALRMVEDAERDGRLKPGGTIIENTGGNTGIGVAYVAAVKGYKCIICMVDTVSQEKEDVLKALGSEVVRTDGKLKYTDPSSDFGVAHRLAEEIPNSFYVGQWQNKSNPLVMYDITAEELLYQCDGKIDMFVGGSGTGGTLTGVGRKLKETIPDVKVGHFSRGSSGHIMWGALEAAKELGPGQRCVVMQPDGMRNYLSKFLDDEWMRQRGWLD